MTRARQLEWCEPVRGAGEDEIRAAEVSLGVRYPDDYREYLSIADGGMPVESDSRQGT
jgi:cell wall assembly regulator SMI1